MARARQPKPKRKKPWKWALLGISVVVIAILGFVVYEVYGTYNGLDKLSNTTSDPKFTNYRDRYREAARMEGKERVNILIMGGDNRGLQENSSIRFHDGHLRGPRHEEYSSILRAPRYVRRHSGL